MEPDGMDQTGRSISYLPPSFFVWFPVFFFCRVLGPDHPKARYNRYPTDLSRSHSTACSVPSVPPMPPQQRLEHFARAASGSGRPELIPSGSSDRSERQGAAGTGRRVGPGNSGTVDPPWKRSGRSWKIHGRSASGFCVDRQGAGLPTK